MHPVPFYNWFCKFMNKFVSFSVSAWHSEPCFDFVRRKSGMRHSLNLTEPVSLIHNRWMSRVRPTNLPIRTVGVCAASTGFTISWLIFKCERGNSDESFPCNHQEKPPEYSLLWYFIKVKGLFSDLVSWLCWPGSRTPHSLVCPLVPHREAPLLFLPLYLPDPVVWRFSNPARENKKKKHWQMALEKIRSSPAHLQISRTHTLDGWNTHLRTRVSASFPHFVTLTFCCLSASSASVKHHSVQ